MYEHNALGYWSGLALCLTKVLRQLLFIVEFDFILFYAIFYPYILRISSNRKDRLCGMALQTPFRYTTDAKEIVRNVYEFCKREKESVLTMSLHQAKLRTSTGVSSMTINPVVNPTLPNTCTTC